MDKALPLLAAGVALIVIALIVFLVVVPYFKLQALRRKSWEHVPQPQEIWMQDDALIYINDVNPTGVLIVSMDSRGRATTWKDTWEDWHKRLRSRTLWYTGQKRPLGNA